MHGDQHGNRRTEKVEDLFLTQIVTQPTWENNVLCLEPPTGTDLDGDFEVACEHHMIWFSFRTKYELTDYKSRIQDYRNANFDLTLAREVLPHETMEELNGASFDHEWSTFRNKLLAV